MEAKIARMAMLLDTYGGILTDHQREVLRLRYEEDLSLGEIAAQCGISRAAVQDIIRRAEAQLEAIEGAIGALHLRRTVKQNLEAVQSGLQRVSRNVCDNACDAATKQTLAEVTKILKDTLDMV